MNKYAVLGWPIKHSLSPSMHNPAFAEKGIEAHYEAIPCPPDQISEVIQQLKDQGFKGWNCTVPLKEDIIPFLDHVDPEALACQSVNTVIVQENGELHGFSTDGYGLEKAISEDLDMCIKNQRILMVGAGGAARAVAARFAKSGAKSITVINRSECRAQTLIETVQAMNPNCQTQYIAPSELSDTNNPALTHDLMVQCTSLGLNESDPSPYPIELLRPEIALIDMIYAHTPLQKAAEKIGCKTSGGLGMLLHQGVKAWEMWTGVDAPSELMRQELINATQSK